jgi:N-acetylmuramic acid 6-phosphate (MurNAc-6-P) etherase
MMINLKPTNIKLTARMVRIVREITGLEEEAAKKLLEENDWNIRKAVQK